VTPVGTLVSAVLPTAPAPVRSAAAAAEAAAQAAGQAAERRAAARPPAAASGPSTLATAGFSGAGVLAAGLGFAYSRRQRRRA
jgi:hypothetical protein